MNQFPICSKPSFSIYDNDHQKLDMKKNLSSLQILQRAFAFLSCPPLLHLICLSYIELGFVYPITNHECGINIFEYFLLFPSKTPLYLVLRHQT